MDHASGALRIGRAWLTMLALPAIADEADKRTLQVEREHLTAFSAGFVPQSWLDAESPRAARIDASRDSFPMTHPRMQASS